VTTPPPALVMQLADNKYLLGCRFSEWTNRAPALEAAVAAAAMTQDELGHARSLYAILQSTPDAPEAYLNQGRTEQLLGVSVLEQPFQHWTEFVAAAALFDRAMTFVLEAVRNSSYEPLQQRAAKILQEEWFHWQYGQGWLKQLAAGPKTRRAMQTAINQFWHPTADCFVAIQDSPTSESVLTESAGTLRQHWINETGALLSKCGLTIP
jgi:ring-1,2-phenylacetyl-CoA epoxidase subunit PaaC